MHKIKIKRTYDDYESNDGYRILIDRIWPRGIKKEDLHHDEWIKTIAPSNTLRKKFHDDKESFDDFKTDYQQELQNNEATKDFIETVKKQLDQQNVTLLYSSKDQTHNNAVVLKEWVNDRINQ